MLLSLVLINTISAQNLIINEFLIGNDVSATDEYGEQVDFVEIFNTDTMAYDIGGMYITDDLAEPILWQISSDSAVITTIPAGGFPVLWADKQTEQGALHVNLKLGSGGEQIGLYNSDVITAIDTLTYGAQETDVSFGRMPDGSDVWAFFLAPIGTTNNDAVSVEENQEDIVVTEYKLSQNYPSPFNPSTTINFSVPLSGLVTLKVFNILGQGVAELVNEVKPAGSYKVSFDASQLTTGTYFYNVQAGNFSSTKKCWYFN